MARAVVHERDASRLSTDALDEGDMVKATVALAHAVMFVGAILRERL